MGKRVKRVKTTKPPKRKGWTEDDQFTYLSGLIPSFKVAQVNNTTGEIWGPIEDYWFKNWPLAPPTEKERARGATDATRRKKVMNVSISFRAGAAVLTHSWQRIKAWFGNHTRDPTVNPNTSSKAVLDLRDKKRKKLSTTQAYQRLYYQGRIKATVDKQWAERLEHEQAHPPVPPALPSPEHPTMKFRNDVSRVLYEVEEADIKAKVQHYVDNSESESEGSDDGDNEDNEDNDSDEDEGKERKQRIEEAKRINRLVVSCCASPKASAKSHIECRRLQFIL